LKLKGKYIYNTVDRFI